MRHIKGRDVISGDRPRCKIVKALDNEADRIRVAEEAWRSVKQANAKRSAGRGVRVGSDFGSASVSGCLYGKGEDGKAEDGKVEESNVKGLLNQNEGGSGNSSLGSRTGIESRGITSGQPSRGGIMGIGFLVS
jgi:hypothetical protein